MRILCSTGFQPVPRGDSSGNGLKTRATWCCILLFVIVSGVKGAGPTTAPSDAEAKYSATIEKRVTGILDELKLQDDAKKTKVHDILISQYRALRDWQDANQAKLKEKNLSADEKQQILATRQPLHDKFVAQLNEELTPEQVEQVKDTMTYNTVQVTYRAYNQFVPTLTETQKAKILEFLKQGREEAIDGGSQEEKAAIFKKYKGKIANYLNAEGIDIKKATTDYMNAQKKKPATEP